MKKKELRGRVAELEAELDDNRIVITTTRAEIRQLKQNPEIYRSRMLVCALRENKRLYSALAAASQTIDRLSDELEALRGQQ